MNHTAKMAALLGRLRREMNGAVSESMQRAGLGGGLNYGVSLPTIRSIAREVEPDHEFARFLFQQQVRELRLAALSIARPEALTIEQLGEWISENPSREELDELAMQLLSRAPQPVLRHLNEKWLTGSDERACYVALMALNRSQLSPQELWPQICTALEHFPQRGSVARAAVAFCSFHPEAYRSEQVPKTDSGALLREEYEALFG